MNLLGCCHGDPFAHASADANRDLFSVDPVVSSNTRDARPVTVPTASGRSP